MLRNSLANSLRASTAASTSRNALAAVARPAFAAQRSAAAPVVGAVQRRGYHDKVIDHYENPRNVSFFLFFSVAVNAQTMLFGGGFPTDG